jgi:hypothetical protein
LTSSLEGDEKPEKEGKTLSPEELVKLHQLHAKMYTKPFADLYSITG